MMPRRTRPIIYLAARYSRREELQGYATQLSDLGLADVPARWLWEDHDWDGDTSLLEDGTAGESLLKAQRFAMDDVADLERSHAVVLFTEEAGNYRRGGSLVEYGLALALQKHIVIVGPAPNVFCTLPLAIRLGSWTDALAHLVWWRDQMEQIATRKKLMI